jgi:exodeoxyribonuclease VII large subunit
LPSNAVQSDVLSVTAYSTLLGRALRAVGSATIEGEVQKPKTSGSGALWFSLTDGESVLPAKVFRSQVRALEHTPREGDLVQVEVDRPDLWAQAGKLDLIVSQVRLAGEGELLRRRQELIGRLTNEGLCDPGRRHRLPKFPRAVGVIAGVGSDAMSDVKRSLIDRWPGVHIVTCSSLVQGKGAPRDVIDALARMTEHPLVDVVIVARGGGSVQDLACFDDESLCRAVFACELPVVCAIGHTDNNPVCNHVAWPAYTPSRAAELVVPSATELRRDIETAGSQLDDIAGHLAIVAERVERAGERLDCGTMLEARASLIREYASSVQSGLEGFLANGEHGLQRAQGILEAVPHRAARQLAAGRERLPELASTLASAGESVERLRRDVRTLGQTVRTGTRRQADDHARDYSRAFERLLREVRAGLQRRATRATELIGRDADDLAERARRRLADAEREAKHACALIAAHDFRPRGWLLAADAEGTPVRSSATLRTGQHIDLHLHDGRANVVVHTINPTTRSETP